MLHTWLLEATGGFEPPNRGFADPCLRPLGYVAVRAFALLAFGSTGAEGEARTHTPLRAQRPQRCSSTNSDTSARGFRVRCAICALDGREATTAPARVKTLERPTRDFGGRRAKCHMMLPEMNSSGPPDLAQLEFTIVCEPTRTRSYAGRLARIDRMTLAAPGRCGSRVHSWGETVDLPDRRLLDPVRPRLDDIDSTIGDCCLSLRTPGVEPRSTRRDFSGG